MSKDLTGKEPPPEQPKSETITWSPWITAILVIGSFLTATVIAQLLVQIYPVLKHMTSAQSQDWLNNSTLAQFIFTVLAYGLLLLPLWLFVRSRKVSLGTFGIKLPRLKDFGYGLATIVPYYFVYFMIVAVVKALVPGLNTDQQQQIGFQDAHGGILILAFLSLVIIPPLVEETVVRGFLYTSFRAKLALPLAVILTSIIFAAGHLQFGSGAPLLWIAAIDTFTLSLFLIYLRQKTGSLWASITLHALKNGIAFFYLFIYH